MLLKNDGVLPLRPGARIALIGPLADSAQNMLGAWSAKGEAGDVVTLRAALAERLGAGAGLCEGHGHTQAIPTAALPKRSRLPGGPTSPSSRSARTRPT